MQGNIEKCFETLKFYLQLKRGGNTSNLIVSNRVDFFCATKRVSNGEIRYRVSNHRGRIGRAGTRKFERYRCKAIFAFDQQLNLIKTVVLT